jgi:hypothetical protein
MPLTLMKGRFKPLAGRPDGDSVRFLADDLTLWARLEGAPPEIGKRPTDGSPPLGVLTALAGHTSHFPRLGAISYPDQQKLSPASVFTGAKRGQMSVARLRHRLAPRPVLLIAFSVLLPFIWRAPRAPPERRNQGGLHLLRLNTRRQNDRKETAR